MKKSNSIISLCIMLFALIVAVVGVSAAWFGDVKSQSDVIVITSYAPIGNASVALDSTSDYSSGSLMPASVISALGNRTGANLLDSIDVLDPSLVGNKLNNVATTVTISFDFVYAGAADSGYNDKAIRIYLTSATLINPRTSSYIPIATYITQKGLDDENDVPTNLRYSRSGTEGSYTYTQNNSGNFVMVTSIVSGLADYSNEFGYIMDLSDYKLSAEYVNSTTYYTLSNDVYSVASPQPTSANFAQGEYYVVAPWTTWTRRQEGNELYLEADLYTTATFQVTIYFAKIDEETSPELLDTTVFFNFQIESATREL